VHAEKAAIGRQTMEWIFIVHVEMMEKMGDKCIGAHVLIGRKGTIDRVIILIEANKNDGHVLLLLLESVRINFI
jgi:hypothetical protein